MAMGSKKHWRLVFSMMHQLVREGRAEQSIQSDTAKLTIRLSGTSGFGDSRRQFHMFFFFDSRCRTIFAIGPESKFMFVN